MPLPDIYVVSDKLETATAADVARAEEQIGSRFPTGYPQYVQRFGRGSLNEFLRVYPPDEVVTKLATWRETRSTYWFWNEPHPEITQARVLDSVPLADTEYGDILCFHRDDPDVAIVLPRSEKRIRVIEGGLAGAVDWAFSSGVLLRPAQRPLAFECFVGRRYVRHQSTGRAALVRIRQELLALGTHALVAKAADYSVVYFPAIKGKVALLKLDDGRVDGLIQHDEDVAATAVEEIQQVLERAGLPYQVSW